MNTDIEKEVIQVVELIFNYLTDQHNIGVDNCQLSHISVYIHEHTSICPIWKRSKISISDFVQKFPQNFSFDKTNCTISLANNVFDSKNIIEAWNLHKTDHEILNEKIGKDLEIFKLPSDLEIVTTDNHNVCNEWIINSVYALGNQVVGFDTETTIGTQQGKPSIIQLSTKSSNLIISLADMETLPSELVSLLLDKTILKIGVGIIADMQQLSQYYTDLSPIQGVLNLSDLAKSLGIEILNAGNNGHSLRDLTAIVLSLFLNDKGLSDVKKTNWDSKDLSQEQIEYAVSDAFIACEIFNKLKELPDTDTFLNFVNQNTVLVVALDKKIDTDKANNKKLAKEHEESKKKLEIDRKIKKWLKDEDSTELIFEPMNSFYRNYVHSAARNNSTIKSESRGIEPAKYVVLVKCTQ